MPPKGKRTIATGDAFLFVNEDFGTLFGGTRNADFDRSKQSHVQRQSFARRKQSRRARSRSAATSPSAGQHAHSPTVDSSATAIRSQPEDALPFLPISLANNLWLPAAADENTFPSQFDARLPLSEAHASHGRPNASTSEFAPSYPEHGLLDNMMFVEDQSFLFTTTDLPTRPEGVSTSSPVGTPSSDDPFDNLQSALEKWAPPLMRYFATKMVPDFFYTDLRATSLHKMRHVESLHEDMRSCMSNAVEMYALLAASACHAMERDGKLDLPDLRPEDSDRVALLFKSKAFEALRLRLSGGDLSHGTVIAIHRMICVALYTNNFSTVEAHYRAALSMIQTVGGAETFNDLQKEMLIAHDFFFALSTASPPQLNLTWDPGELSPEVNLELVLHMNENPHFETGQRIQTLADNSVSTLDSTVAQCMLELVETQQVLEWLRKGQYRPLEYRWLAHRRLAIIHRLLNVSENLSTGPSEPTRLALLYYCAMARMIPYGGCVLVDKWIVPEVRRWEASRSAEDAFDRFPDLLLWIVVVFGTAVMAEQATSLSPKSTGTWPFSPQGQQQGSQSTANRDSNLDVAARLSRIGQRLCRRLGISSEGSLRQILRTFLFDQDLIDDNYLTFVRRHLHLSD